MKKLSLFPMLAIAMLASCGQKTETTQDTNMNEKVEKQTVVDVPGRKNFGDNAIITPLPAIMIATYDKDENPDVMMAAWGGQCGKSQICFELGKHQTTDNIRLNKAFTISFASVDNIVQSDYFGIVSAYDVPDKVAKAGFTVTKSPNVNAPIINEYPLTLECKVASIQDHESGGASVIGDIINMSCDESILTDGKVDLSKLKPVIFDSSSYNYRAVGDSVGTAWGSGKVLE